MKIIFPIVLGLSTFLSCTNSTPATKESETGKSQIPINDTIENIALQNIFDKISTIPKVRFKDNEILIGDTSIRIKVNVESDGEREGRWIYAASVTTIYKAGKEIQMTVGAIGIGSTKGEAVNAFIQEWFGFFAMAFTNMLNDDKGITVSNMKVFSGPMGIRGSLPPNTWLRGDDSMTQKIISQIQQQIKTTAGDIIPIDIKLMIDKGGVTDGECRINNQASTELLNNLKQLDWPSSDGPFMLKEFYLVKKPGK